MSALDLLIIGLVLAGSGAIASAIGFAFGLFSVPLLVLLGLPLPQVIPLVGGAMVAQTLLSLHRHRDELPGRSIFGWIGVCVVGAAVGVWVLGMVAAMGSPVVKPVVGLVLLLAVLLQCFVKVEPRPRLHVGWGVLAMGAGGFLTGLSGMGGPPKVLWVMAHDWSSARSRTTLWSLFLGLTPFQLAFLAVRFGTGEVMLSFVQGLAYFPLVMAGSVVGLWIGGRMSKPLLRQAAMTVLLIIALNAIVSPWLSGPRPASDSTPMTRETESEP